MTEPVNGRPGWRDVLHAVELSESRVSEKIDRNSIMIKDVDTKVEALDHRVERLERTAEVRHRRNQELFRLAGGVRGVTLFAVAIIGAGLGMINTVQ